MRASLTLLSLLLVAACVNVDDTLSRDGVTAVSASRGGLPQRLWEQYALRDIGGNALPAIYADSGDVRYRVLADTIYFTFATGDFREIAVVRREDGIADETFRLASPAREAYVHLPTDSIAFPSLLFGRATGGLSGATRVQPFSPTMTIAGSRAVYVMF